ncbi:MAG: polyamine ABC transporter substrate-binding protein [Frankia sp.]
MTVPHDPNRQLSITDPALLRGLTQRRLGRRDFLRLAGLSGGAAALAACGVSGAKKNNGGSTTDAVSKYWAGKTQAGTLDFASWPLYMDVSENNKNDHPSLDLFTKQHGIKVNYKEVIQDDDSFFGTIQPSLAANQSIGYDLMVITNGLVLDKLINLGYLAPLDHSKLPTFAKNASPSVTNPSYDPNNAYTVAWQSGLTGIGYDPKRTGREITSYEDLFDPKFKGKVGMFGDNQDLPTLALVGMGIKPETATPDDWRKAAAKLKKQRDDGLVRKYYEQDYIDPLSKGDIWISMAWSGDIFQANASGANLKFVAPKEGSVLWTDNMCIPYHAAHPVDAITYMDFVYQPTIAAMLAEAIDYITPVPAANAAILSDAAKLSGSDAADLKELATDPLIFPSSAELAKAHRYQVLNAAQEKEWNSIFEPIYQA